MKHRANHSQGTTNLGEEDLHVGVVIPHLLDEGRVGVEDDSDGDVCAEVIATDVHYDDIGVGCIQPTDELIFFSDLCEPVSWWKRH